MMKSEIRKVEKAHMIGSMKFFYRGRFIVCEYCLGRFKMRHNGTLHYIEPKA